MERSEGRRPRSPGVVYATLSTVMLMVLGVIALRTTQPPPPSIAEFAPQAVEQIDEAPAEQQSKFGRGEGSGPCTPGDTDCVVDSTGALVRRVPADQPPISVPRVRQCVGDPPRQIEDPQSPPCVPYWDGDNGGETWKGVTRNQITVVSPFYLNTIHPHLEAFFNRRFEFYGRKIKIVEGNNGSGNAEEQRRWAKRADEELHGFASLHYHGENGFQYMDEIARRKMIGVWSYASVDEGSLAKSAPHLWQYPMPVDRMLRDQGEWACHRLAGLDAIHAGDDVTRGKKRKFGLILERLSAEPVTGEPLENALKRCGEGLVKVEGGRVGSNFTAASGVMLKMKEAEVTSIFCVCQTHGYLSSAATSQAYFPEWLVSSFLFLDSNQWLRWFTTEQRSQVFGLSYQPRHLSIPDEPPTHALQQGGGSETAANDTFNREYLHIYYRGLLLLASGIQMAGPNLTPETFQRGLHRARFPNPETPLNAGQVGFSDGDHGMTNDATEFWWSNTAPSPYAGDDGSGTMCYVDGGKRHVGAGWASALGDHTVLFSGPCDSGAS